nr:MAG TPA: hypothetical protein [Caudoviricetes sp.]
MLAFFMMMRKTIILLRAWEAHLTRHLHFSMIISRCHQILFAPSCVAYRKILLPLIIMEPLRNLAIKGC